jgi:hypothetical protein
MGEIVPHTCARTACPNIEPEVQAREANQIDIDGPEMFDSKNIKALLDESQYCI